ncbi:uncharacterized protein LOC134228382 [Saccostrea cucullata]|uniref:uncharacterized protein LOC134228382 n=1 Tax=Saccostrea cuccullata TaxID=36930 RepID=UPI002ED4642F
MIIIILLLFSFFEVSTLTRCNSTNGIECCDDHIWNITAKQCIPCSPGYVGRNCTVMCPYPLYGFLCNSKCDCSEGLCNRVTGCPFYNGSVSDGFQSDIGHGASVQLQETTTAILNGTDLCTTVDLNTTFSPNSQNYINKILLKLIRGLGSFCALSYTVYFIIFVYDINRNRQISQQNRGSTENIPVEAIQSYPNNEYYRVI